MWLKQAAAIGSQACISFGAALRRGQPRRPLLAPGALFTTTASHQKIQTLPPRPKPPPDEEITELYLKGSGPGGQKINKTSSAVQLKHLPTGIVVKCQETRSRSQNRKLAREHLAAKIDDLLNGQQSRSAVVARIMAKKKASAMKKSHRKHVRAHRLAVETGKQDEEENDDEYGDAEDDGPLDLPTEQSGSKNKPLP